MAFNYTGDAVLGVSLSVEVPKPLDNRSVVKNLTELYSIPAKYAYQGMTVANIEDGNMYMLIDITHISDKTGWKASYESIQIITCTEQEYREWEKNTTPEFTPINPEQTFLHSNTYYYIYEDSLDDNQFYLSAEWGKQIEKTLGTKANSDSVNRLQIQVTELTNNLSNNYTTTEIIYNTFLKKVDLDDTIPTSAISKILEKYYTKEKSDELFLTKTTAEDIYVTKESLRGDTPSTGEDDFIFVTQKKYSDDKAAAAKRITTNFLSSPNIETQNISINSDTSLSSEQGRLTVNNKQIANLEEVPKIEVISQAEYDKLEIRNPDVFYYTYGEKSLADTGYITSEFLYEKYYSKKEVDKLIAQISGLSMKVEEETLIFG